MRSSLSSCSFVPMLQVIEVTSLSCIFLFQCYKSQGHNNEEFNSKEVLHIGGVPNFPKTLLMV
jgi:hypothetical protein